MPHRIPIPADLHGRAFRVDAPDLAGLTTSRLRGRDVDAPFTGVRAVGLDLHDLVDRCTAAAPLLGARACFSHVTAALLHGAPLPRILQDAGRPLDVAALGGSRMQRRGVRGHELPADTPITRSAHGFWLTAAADTWCQLAAEASHRSAARRLPLSFEDLVAVGDAFVSGTRGAGGVRVEVACSIRDLADAVVRHGSRRGVALLREALPLVRPSVDAHTETVLRLTLVDAGFEEPVAGYRISTPEGDFTPDLSWPRERIAFEYEGDQHRTDRGRWRSDFRRHRALQSMGWIIIRVNADDLAHGEGRARFLAQVRRTLALREA